MAVATVPANNDNAKVCIYEGYQNLLNDPVVASIILLISNYYNQNYYNYLNKTLKL